MISCLIVDDEPLAREVIQMHVSRLEGWQIVAQCENAAAAFEALINRKIDVIFLDVQMPRVLGTDFLRSLKDPPKIIFTTAHPGFAVEGFELNAVDYLLKPITFERFLEAAKKIEKVPLANKPTIAEKSLQRDEFIFVKQDTRLVKVYFSDILFLEAKRDFTLLQLKDKKLLASFHLKMLEDMLPSSQFMRIHRSYIVNLNAIEVIYGNTVELKGFQIPVSPVNRDALTAALKL